MYAKDDSIYHHRAAGVPGTVAGLALAHRTFGRLPWRALVAPAVRLAEQALAISAAQGDRHHEAALHNNLADLLQAMGQAEAARQHVRQSVMIYAEIGAEAGRLQPEIWKLAEW